MRDPTAEKFRMMWLKLYFYKGRGGCCKTICEVAWANAISAKFKGVSIKLTECALDYLLILIKFEGFFVKLPSHYILILIKFGVFCKIAEPSRQSEPSTRDPTTEIFEPTWLNGGIPLLGLGFYKINWVWAGLHINFNKIQGVFYKIVESHR